MDYPIKFGDQLKQQLRSLRKARGLNQTELGVRLSVTQRRIAEIEANPGVVAVDQIIRIFSALGAELLLRDPSTAPAALLPASAAATNARSPTGAATAGRRAPVALDTPPSEGVW